MTRFFVWGSITTSAFYAGRKLLGFSFWIKISLDFIVGIETDLVFVWAEILRFNVWIDIDLVVVCRLKMTLFRVGIG